MSTADNFWKYFHEIFGEIPRQGPGTRESTERALKRIPLLNRENRILDIGSGTGAQTFDLAGSTDAYIIAIDNHPPYIDKLVKRSKELGFDKQITAQVGDMADLKFPDGSFDVVWSEGAIFIIGFAQGLSSWRRLLKPGGHMVISEYCWFKENPPKELVELHFDGCPEAGTVAARKKDIDAQGYKLVDEFVLPAAGWWENFYVPLGNVLERFRKKYAGNAEALEVASRCQLEIDLCRKHADFFGYVFFVLKS
ncbi:MAG: class I SAM-dependent methyltransferase [Myxococcota bacterium]|nr:class I SAM-dependent methyltransferase [Myxococcota bacterium]